MVFHESLNPERKFSLAIPLVFIAILGGTTAVLEVATVLSPQSSYAVNARSQLAEGAAPVGGDKDACQAGHIYEVIVDAKATVKTEDVGKKVDCEAKDAQGKKINQGHVMCSGGKGEGFGRVSYLLPTGSANSVECLPGEDVTKTGLNDARAAAAAQYKTSTKLLQEGMGFDENIGDTSFPNPAGNVDNNLKNQDRALRDYQILSQALVDQTPINSPTISQTPDVNNAIKGYGGESDTPIPDDYQGENPGAIDAALKNSASYLGPTSPGLSQSDLLRMPLDQLNGDYKYGDITVSTDGREYSVSQDGERIAVIKEVREGQTVADVIADKQYYNGPESPYQSSRDTFAANVVAQGEVPYSSARGTPEQTDTSAFDKWSAGLPGANIQGPAYDFSSDALDPGVAKAAGDAKGDWTKDFSFNCETAGAGASVLDTPLGNLPQGETKIGDNITVLRDGNNISIQDTGLNPKFSAPVDISRLGNTVGDVVGSFQGNNSPISNASTYGKNVELLGETPYSVGASDYAASGNWTYGPGDAEAYSAENLQKQLDTTQAKLDAASAQMPRAALNALVAERNQLQGMIDQSKPYAAAENFEKAFCQNSVEPGCNGVPKKGDNTRSLAGGGA